MHTMNSNFGAWILCLGIKERCSNNSFDHHSNNKAGVWGFREEQVTWCNFYLLLWWSWDRSSNSKRSTYFSGFIYWEYEGTSIFFPFTKVFPCWPFFVQYTVLGSFFSNVSSFYILNRLTLQICNCKTYYSFSI